MLLINPNYNLQLEFTRRSLITPCTVKMTTINIKYRRVFRRTDDYTPGSPKLELTHESLPSQLSPTSVLVKVHAVSLNYRDANIVNGGNPWPVIPHGIPCNDAAGEVIATGTDVKTLNLGDRVAPVIDTENITGRESTRSWLAADEDGVLADYLIFDERVLSILPSHLSWAEACLIPCAGTTAWAALEGFGMGKSVLIQGLKVTPEDTDAFANESQRYWRCKYVRSEARSRCRPPGYLELVERGETSANQGPISRSPASDCELQKTYMA